MIGWHPPPEPTAEACTANDPVSWDAGPNGELHGFACWYPQMGGYVGRCVVEFGEQYGDADAGPADRCFEAWVWHDGDFPFADGDPPRGDDGSPCPVCERRPVAGPIRLHHCMARQFVDFGQLVQAKMRETAT